MGSAGTPDPGHEQRLSEVLVAYLEALETGQAPDPQQWLARYPDLASDLAAFIGNEQDLRRLAAPLRSPLPRQPAPVPALAEGATVLAPASIKDVPSHTSSARVLGDYLLLEEIARGGMGVVYKAWQISLKRPVALKMILTGPFATAADRLRFRAEAEAAARLDHPNIVPIYQVGEQEGYPFLCLKLVEGATLAQKLRGQPLPISEAVRLVEILARAIHYAHQRKIIHRDLKPANILLAPGSPSSSETETPSETTCSSGLGIPLITDFGLAKQLDNPGELTQTGQIMGTPNYMAPEQAYGQGHRTGPAVDVYALGAILYECLTGRPPFQAATPHDILELVRSEEPAPPRILNPRIDQDLQSICLKCLEKEPQARYSSAAALADDLHRYSNGESVSVHTYNVFLRISRTLEKHNPTEDEFRTWCSALRIFAVLIFAGHFATFAFMTADLPRILFLFVRACEFVLGGAVAWHYSRQRLGPASRAERQLESIWIGYLASFVVSALALRLLVGLEIIRAGPGGPPWWRELLSYPVAAALTGLGFFVMGGFYWGRYYVLAGAFFVLALVMPFHLEWAPLEFGGLWTVCLLGIVRHLQKRAALAEGFHGDRGVV